MLCFIIITMIVPFLGIPSLPLWLLESIHNRELLSHISLVTCFIQPCRHIFDNVPKILFLMLSLLTRIPLFFVAWLFQWKIIIALNCWHHWYTIILCILFAVNFNADAVGLLLASCKCNVHNKQQTIDAPLEGSWWANHDHILAFKISWFP